LLQTLQWSSSSGAITPTTSTDRIGIGASSFPAAQLQVSGVYGTNLFRVVGNPDAAPGNLWLLDSGPALGFPGGILMKFEGNGQIQFPYMYIGFAGNPVIQSTSSQPLQLNTNAGGGDVVVGNTSSNGSFVLQSQGNVGVGVRYPEARLEIVKSSTYTQGATAGLSLANSNPFNIKLDMGVDNVSGIGYLQTRTPGSYVTQYLALQPAGGRVGIGTAAPSQTLTVNGVAQATGGFLYPDGNVQSVAYQPSSGSLTVNTGSGGQQSKWSTGAGTNIDVWGSSTPANNFVAFRTTNVANSTQVAEVMRITSDGRLLIGTQSAVENAKLEVNGDVHVSGTLKADSVFNAVYGQDVAEWVRGDRELAPGTVVIVNPEKTNEVMPSRTAYDTTVAGVVSAQPGIILGRAGELKATVATSGRVRVRVDARKGPIRVGDLLVTGDEPGTAMKSQPIEVNGRRFHQPGTIIGKALEPLEGGVGEILVLLCMG
jgi:hypothetical protein